MECGTWDNGCNGTVTCGPCVSGTCNEGTGQCQASECTVTDGPRCSGDVIQTCPSGSWIDGQDCAAGCGYCMGGTCQTSSSCSDGDVRCNAMVAEACEYGVFMTSLDCGSRGETCINGACVGNSQLGQACPGQGTYSVVNPSAPSCMQGLTCSVLDPDAYAVSCDTVADCPIPAEYHPTCQDNACGASACVQHCGTSRTCTGATHPEDIDGQCWCMPGALRPMMGLCSTEIGCQGSMLCVSMSPTYVWGYCTSTCTGNGNCINGSTCSVVTQTQGNFCGVPCPSQTAAECPQGWRCYNKAIGGDDWMCTPQ